MKGRSDRTDWRVMIVATLAGIVAAMQLGKVPPVIPAIQQDLGVSLVMAGWIVSVFNLMAATLAVAMGLLADRVDSRKVLAGGLLMLLLGAFAGGFADCGYTLILARALAGIGLVSIAVAAPRMIVGASAPRDYSLTLGVWSIYMPSGIALGMLLTPLLLPHLGWRQIWFANGALLVLFLLLFLLASPWLKGDRLSGQGSGAGWGDLRRLIHAPGPWLLGAVFACYTIPYFAVISWFPLFLVETQGTALATAAAYGALVVAANVIGNLGAAWLLHRGAQRWQLQMIGFGVMALCGTGIFSPLLGVEWKIPLAVLFSAVGGLLPAVILAASPVHAAAPGQVATVNGFVVQGASIGSLLGPPVMALTVALSGGWSGSWWLILIATVIGMLLVLKLHRLELQLASTH